jgi:hypothetical protein
VEAPAAAPTAAAAAAAPRTEAPAAAATAAAAAAAEHEEGINEDEAKKFWPESGQQKPNSRSFYRTGEPPPHSGGSSEAPSVTDRQGVFDDTPQRYAKSTSPEEAVEDRENPETKERKLADARRRTRAAYDRIRDQKRAGEAGTGKDSYSADWHSAASGPAASAEGEPTPAAASPSQVPPVEQSGEPLRQAAEAIPVKIEPTETRKKKKGTPESTSTVRSNKNKSVGDSSKSSRRRTTRPRRKRKLGVADPSSSSKAAPEAALASVPEQSEISEAKTSRRPKGRKPKRRRKEKSKKHKGGKGRRVRNRRPRSTSSSSYDYSSSGGSSESYED